MALNVQMILSENKLIGEKIVTPRLVNQQTLDYETFCDYLAQGSTITAADVSAVMKQIEKNIPLILGLNAKIIASPEGLVFRPSIKGSITQSQLKAKLVQRKKDYVDAGDLAAAAKVNVDRALEAGDLATSDLQACIVIDLPKKWDARFQQSVTYKRIVKNPGVAVDPELNPGGTETPVTPGTQQGVKKTITASASPSNGGTVTGGGSYTVGEQVTLNASPSSGYAFSKWDDGNTSASRQITVSEDKTYRAIFVSTAIGDEDEGH